MIIRRMERHLPIARDVILALAAFLSHSLTCGVSYSLGVYYVTFLDVFGHSNGVTSWIGSLNTGILCLIGPLASVMIDRFGCGATVIVGGFTAFVGLAISAFATNIFHLFVSLGVIAGLGYGMVFTAAIVVIATCPSPHRSLVLGVTFSGVSVGNFVYPFLASWLNDVYDWRGSLLITAALTLHVCFFGMLMLNVSRDGRHRSRGGRRESRDRDADRGDEVADCDRDSRLCARKDPGLVVHSVQSLDQLISDHFFCETSGLASTSGRNALSRSSSAIDRGRQPSHFDSLPHLVLSPNSDRSIQHTDKLPGRLNNNQWRAADQSRDKPSNHQWRASDASRDHLKGDLAPNSVAAAGNPDVHNKCGSKYLYPCTLYSYWLLYCSAIFNFFSISVVLTHIFAYARHQGLDSYRATVVFSTNGAANVAGRILLGALTQRRCISPLALCAVSYVISGSACLAMTAWTSYPGLVVCTAAFGFFWAALGPVLSEALMDVVGAEHFNFAYGFLMMPMALGVLVGAPTAGFVYDVTDKYTSSFYLGGSSLVFSALLVVPVLFIKKSSRQLVVSELDCRGS